MKIYVSSHSNVMMMQCIKYFCVLQCSFAAFVLLMQLPIAPSVELTTKTQWRRQKGADGARAPLLCFINSNLAECVVTRMMSFNGNVGKAIYYASLDSRPSFF